MVFLRENAARIAAWLPLLFAVLAAAALTRVVLARRRRQRAPVAWFFLPGFAIALIVALGPMAPLFRNARRLESWRGHPVPAIAFRDVESGADRRIEMLRGRVVMVNLWATWCPPCRQEMPALNRLQEAYAGRGVIVLTLTDESPQRVRDFLRRYAPATMNGTTSFAWLPVGTFRPFTFIVDRDGVVRRYFFGSQEYTTFENAVRQYL